MALLPEKYELKSISVSDLLLDPDNPRFLHLKLEKQEKLTQDDLTSELENEDDTITLAKSVRQRGVLDPIWVKSDGNKFFVLEGNRRTVVLRLLLKEKVKPPAGIHYDRVMAHVIPEETTPGEIALIKIVLQAGKKKWDAYNRAAFIYLLRHEHGLEVADIADSLQTSQKDIKEEMENFRLFNEFVKATGEHDHHRFSFFQEAPRKVRDWFTSSSENKKAYFSLISSKDGKQKIRGAAYELRDFAKIVDDQDALAYLLHEPTATVEDALEIAKENDIKKEMPFIGRVGVLAANLRNLTETQVEKLKTDVKFKVELKALHKVGGDLLEKLK